MNNTENQIILDVVPSIQDERDYRYEQKKIELKESVDLREWDSSVDDQSSLGSCVGNAIANAYELMVRRLYPSQFAELSRLFIYYNSRLFDNSIKEDIGTYIRDGLKAAARYGICSEKAWPYTIENFDQQPPAECYVEASQRVITRYETLYTLRDLLEVLNNNTPIVIGMSIYEGFMEMGPRSPVVKMPTEYSSYIGSHAVTVLGYNYAKQMFLAKNSFGKSWGDGGYFWIPFEYMRSEVFEKWCFDINTQSTIDIDSKPEPIVKPVHGYGDLVVSVTSGGVKVKQLSREQFRTRRRT